MIRAGRYICETDRPYGQRVAWALALAVLLHGIALLLLPRSWWGGQEAHLPALFGPPRLRAELSPDDVSRARSIAQGTLSRRLPGALVVMEIEILADEEPRARTRPPVVGAVQVVARQAEIREEDRGSSAEPVIELGEDLSPRASSVPSMTAEDFAILEMVRPDYPEASVLQNIEGRIRIRARVDGSGSVVDIWVVDTEVDVFIEASVRHAVRQWRFKPYRRGGRSLPFTVLVPFRFELED